MNNLNILDSILVIGSGSLVGSRFIELAAKSAKIYGAGGEADKNNPNVVSFQSLDITDPENVNEVINNCPGKYVINFAGATIVDEIEKTRSANPFDQQELNKNIAYKVNVIGTQNIIDACIKSDKFPIFISTGFVFDGENGPYSEDSPIVTDPSKVSWYAWTKILAETAVVGSDLNYLMLRISYPYRSEFDGKTDFARSFLKLYDEVDSGQRESFYPIFADQTLSPTFIDDLPAAVAVLLEKNAHGIYDVTSPEITTPYDFCCELLKVARGVVNLEKMVTVGSLIDFQKAHPELARRPIHGGEESGKIIKLGFTPTDWKAGIKKAFGNPSTSSGNIS